MKNKKIYLVNGPNLNLLGKRETNIYGAETLQEIEQQMKEKANSKKIAFDYFQHNEEGKIVTFIQSIEKQAKIIINAAAYTHTSIAIRDAILARELRIAEVHLSNIYKREPFRHRSYLSDIAEIVFCGAGSKGYFYALEYFLSKIGE